VNLPHLSDLHRHLDGSLREATLRELAAGLGVDVPAQFRFSRGMGLAAALHCFDLTLAVLQTPAVVRRVADEICKDAAREGVTTLELRFAPQLHKGASPAAIVDAAAEGVAGRAGLILCGLFGEDPSVLEGLVGVARNCPAVVGIDLAGGPSPTHRHHLRDYTRPFSLARDLGLGRTVHAGEGRPTGAVDDLAAHPLPRLLGAGVQVTVCTDNTLFSNVDAPGEYRRAGGLPGLDSTAVETLAATGHAAAFPRRG
jgi:adenosine deaminase